MSVCTDGVCVGDSDLSIHVVVRPLEPLVWWVLDWQAPLLGGWTFYF